MIGSRGKNKVSDEVWLQTDWDEKVHIQGIFVSKGDILGQRSSLVSRYCGASWE